MTFSNKTYDALMLVAQVILPGAATLYAALSGIWGLPATEQVLGTISAVDVFLGGVLKVQNAKYTPETAGKIVVDSTTDPNKKVYQFQIDGDPQKVIDGNKTITVGVEQGTARPL